MMRHVDRVPRRGTFSCKTAGLAPEAMAFEPLPHCGQDQAESERNEEYSDGKDCQYGVLADHLLGDPVR